MSIQQCLKNKSTLMHKHKADSFSSMKKLDAYFAGKMRIKEEKKRFWQGMKHPHPRGFNLVASSSAALPGLC